MDLSAVIFVALALAWAVYLIPKALKHHDDMASDRLVEGHTERVRILRRSRVHVDATTADVESVESVEAEVVEAAPSRAERRRARTAERPAAAPVSRSAARRAAQRRRRVLGVLVLALAILCGLAAVAVVPRWSVGVPAGAILLFLVVARLSVRRQSAVRRPALRPVVADEPAVFAEAPVADAPVVPGVRHEEAVEEAALADDGGLWDPVPLTLPTYVSKARARRTVRTIELTGLQSSGHSEADSALAREADAATEEPAADESRRVAGA